MHTVQEQVWDVDPNEILVVLDPLTTISSKAYVRSIGIWRDDVRTAGEHCAFTGDCRRIQCDGVHGVVANA